MSLRRIDLLRRRRRLVIGGFAAAGAMIAGPPLIRLPLAANLTLPIHFAVPVVFPAVAPVIASCAAVVALWLLCVGAES
jgi:hypothetical protein